ncbi:MAG: diadenylate cyclase CdaA [Proteobacteria bacterium]|nr:diadenylate cyclase CdaA [Pseudomonadota bacterium]
MFQYFDSVHTWIEVAEILVIFAIAWLFYRRFIRGTGSEKLVRGLIGLGIMWVASLVLMWLGLDILGTFVRWIAMFLSVGLVVIFQPELRKFLGLMGQVTFLRAMLVPSAFRQASDADAAARAADEVFRAAEYMSQKRTGALIVFRDNLDGTIEKVGTKIDAEISSELLLTIFFNKTPLHDGAVIIGGNRVLYAGAILPLTANSNLEWKYGTRHRAAIGMSEESDSYVLVVSEETGDISIAHNGQIKKYDDMKKLRAAIEKILIR